MDLRTQTSLIASVLCFAVTATVLLRPRKQRVHYLFGVFGLNVALWYLTTFLLRVLNTTSWERANLVCAVLLPVSAVLFFRTFAEAETPRGALLHRASMVMAAVFIAILFTPFYDHILVASAIFIYVVSLLTAGLWRFYSLRKSARSRFEQARLTYLVLVGALAATFAAADYLPYVGLDIPPVGTVLTLLFLYVLSQAILRHRLLDLYELAGRLAVLTAVSFTLAGIFSLLVFLASGRFFLHAVVAALVVLLVFDPVRSKVEEKIGQIFFRERYDLEQSVTELRKRLAHVLELKNVAPVILEGLERSRRVTHASLYLIDEDMLGYDLVGHVGPKPIGRVERIPARPLLERLQTQDSLQLEVLEQRLDELRRDRQTRDAETVHEVLETMHAMHASVCMVLRGERGIYGLLCVRDERLRDAFTPEEILLLTGVCAQAAIAVENSRLYRHLKEKDRLATLGEMAAGLAHEIRNPLGSIKASAQYLAEPSGTGASHASSEFLDIIVEEVDRLNRVVSSFLDYAKPSVQADAQPIDVNATIARTLNLLRTDPESGGPRRTLLLASSLPPVRMEMEQLRQVLINLVQNALQAMGSEGELSVETAERQWHDVDGRLRTWVEIRVSDTGPGIAERVMANLFVPFVTTKDRGTGLGLAISHRIVSQAGGQIEVRTQAGRGTTFIVRLPAADITTMALPSAAAGRSEEPAEKQDALSDVLSRSADGSRM